MTRTAIREESVRPERIPVSSNRAPLIYKGLDQKNFVHRWVLDKGDRIDRFLEGGYEFVKATAQGTYVGERTVDSTAGTDTRVKRAAGGIAGVSLYLMRIKKEWYEADQKTKAKEVDELEETMRPPRGASSHGGDRPDYGKITLTRKSLREGLKDTEA